MRENSTTWRLVRCALAATLGAGLVACGGGGGSDGSYVALTAANRDSVSHAAAAGLLAFGVADAVPLDAGNLSADRRQARAWAVPAAPHARLLGALLQPLRSSSAAAGEPLKRALAVSGPFIEGCPFGGTMSITFDDRDNSNSPTVGDVMTLAFSNCRESATDTLNGSAVATYTQISVSPTMAVSARLVLGQLSTSIVDHALTLSGSMLLDYRQTSASVNDIKLTADSPVVATVVTHVFNDTVTLRSGFIQETSFDAAAAPPPGSTQGGRSITRVQGEFESIAAGGAVRLSTDAASPLTDFDAEPYPRSGVVRLTGSPGTLLMTVLSAEQVRLDLDADGNGSFESGTTVAWDWLI